MRWRTMVARGLAHYVPHYARTQEALSARARPGNLVRHSSQCRFFPLLCLLRCRIFPSLPYSGLCFPICFIVLHKKKNVKC